ESLEEDALWHLTEGQCTLEDIASYISHSGTDADLPSASASMPAAAPAATPVPRTTRVVIADGDATRRARISALLEAAGYAIEAVADGPSAVARMTVRPADALICAAQLPMMSGLDLIRYVRGLSGELSLPVLGVYDEADQAIREKLL